MIITIVSLGFMIYRFMIIGYILMSWLPALRDSAAGLFLEKAVDPYLGFFRKFIPPLGMIDLSPIIALFVLTFIEQGAYKVISYLMF